MNTHLYWINYQFSHLTLRRESHVSRPVIDGFGWHVIRHVSRARAVTWSGQVTGYSISFTHWKYIFFSKCWMSLIFSLVKLSLASRVWAASIASRRLRLRLQMQTAAAAAPARRRPRLAEAITVVRSSPSSAERLEPEQTPGLASSSPWPQWEAPSQTWRYHPCEMVTWQSRGATYQVLADADVGVTSERISAAKCLWVLESRDDEVESVVGGPPAVGVVPQRHEVGPGDDEPVTAHAQRLRVTRDVSLERYLR